MASTIIARNYAETLLALAQRNGGDAAVDQFGVAIEEVAELLRREPLVRDFLETPRIDLDAKKRALEASFRGRVPDLFLRFVLIVVEKRRQALLQEIAGQYHILVDEARGRLRAEITLAAPADDGLKKEIVRSLESRYGRTIVPTFQVDPTLIGGVVVRIGDQILDGSLGRRVTGLRRRLLETRLPPAVEVGPEF